MLTLKQGALAASVAAMLALAPTALASGGVNAGGVNSGGGGGGGGGTTTTSPSPPTTPPSCATIASFSNSTGYYSVWAAIWTPFSISDSCGYPVSWTMTYTNGSTGAVDFVRTGSTAYQTSGTIDEDWAAFSVSYTVTLTVTDPNTGNELTSRSALVVTKAGKTPGA
ncbi:MAG: hypothetical protein QOH12_979 [Solirubrobacteraceae bacterium]|nr:hypothetical protein [Solirubrobacteraceae bacterium]